MTFASAAVIGFFLGFAFGTGCAPAVMCRIFMDEYRAAVRDGNLRVAQQRLRLLRSKSANSPKR